METQSHHITNLVYAISILVQFMSFSKNMISPFNACQSDFLLIAPCEEEMTFESTYEKSVSSGDDKSGLSNSNKPAWSPDDDDEERSVEVLVSDDTEDVYIDSLEITNMKNVESITVTVIDSTGKEVCVVSK